jgi:hypothetical protein
MRILRYLLMAVAILFLLAAAAFPFGAQFAMRGWYIEDGAAKIAQANQQVEEVRKTFGGKLPAALQKELDQQTAKVGVAQAMARWELGLIPLSLLVLVAMFLEKRVIPLSAAGFLALVAILAIVTIPDLKVGFSSTRFEMLAVGVPAILGAVLAALASLIQTKQRVLSAP